MKQVGSYLPPLLPKALREAALSESQSILETMAQGPLFHRLQSIAPTIVARELEVLLPPDPALEPAPVGYVVGNVDLLYFDQDTREYVVVDYKTDLPRNERGSSGSISPAYLQQLRLYRRAVAQALSPPTPPRAELWFLKTGDRLVAEFKEEGSG